MGGREGTWREGEFKKECGVKKERGGRRRGGRRGYKRQNGRRRGGEKQGLGSRDPIER